MRLEPPPEPPSLPPVDPGHWQPPIGISTPSFGIAEQVSMYVGQLYDSDGDGVGDVPYNDFGNGPFSHYVESAHPFCVDGDNRGTPSQPRCTIPGRDGLPLGAGSVVEVRGDYLGL
ncbi:MAG: hypothetical protein ACKVPX_08920, partial [Myxococcaceae bacterium]